MPIPPSIRNQVRQRADDCCEYCGLHERFTSNTHEIDHIIPVKHGGKDDIANLAWSCLDCNRHKASNVAAFDLETGELSEIFNPRKHDWDTHFSMGTGEILPKTIIGRVTILVLKLNEPELVEFRQILWDAGLYP